MSYQISYEPERNFKYSLPKRKSKKLPVLIGACLLLLAGAVIVPIRNAFLALILPGDAQATKAALSQLMQEIKTGEPLGQAVTAFCTEIIKGV